MAHPTLHRTLVNSWRNGWDPSPEADWRVRDKFGALDDWLASDPPRELVEKVLLWVSVVEVDGPPQDAISVPLRDGLFVASVAATTVTLSYFVIPYEKQVLLDTLDDGTTIYPRP